MNVDAHAMLTVESAKMFTQVRVPAFVCLIHRGRDSVRGGYFAQVPFRLSQILLQQGKERTHSKFSQDDRTDTLL